MFNRRVTHLVPIEDDFEPGDELVALCGEPVIMGSPETKYGCRKCMGRMAQIADELAQKVDRAKRILGEASSC